MAEWQPIETAPRDRPVVVRMPTKHLPSGWFVATVDLPDPEDESRLAGCSAIRNYNGEYLLTRFRGTWTHWLPDDPSALPLAEGGEGK